VHLGCTREEQTRWLAEAWEGACAARADGADVAAITPWALLGSFDWDSLLTQPRGHYECGAFDIRGRQPRPTAVARFIQDLARGRPPAASGPLGRGWWRRPARLLEGAVDVPRPTRQPGGPPLLILGGQGTLGRAVQRISAGRGLSAHAAGRQDLDITDADAVHRLVGHLRPWAVVNAAGYVRVDDAERECDACFSVNTVGAAHVAAACRKAGVPLLTWSTDLVFDGQRDRPYTERDAPRPLSVYGASKAEAERRVLEALPSALVVRTSAFFGPWDDANFAVRALQTLERGHTLRAATDIVISPTYVPDLVHAALDLLVDGESGIWHLTNDGAMSWFDFAHATAIACNAAPHLIQPVACRDFGWPAQRPAYSALSSLRGRVMRPTADAIDAFAASRSSVGVEQAARETAAGELADQGY
jgi:dTDP-4-dehydrorhamnose reductase